MMHKKPHHLQQEQQARKDAQKDDAKQTEEEKAQEPDETLRPAYDALRRSYDEEVALLGDWFKEHPEDREDYPPYPPFDTRWVHHFREAERLQQMIDNAQWELESYEEFLAGGLI